MSYKLNEQRITPGGLDLLVPADQNPRRAALTDLVNVPQGECLDLTDWFAGSDGRLEQAPQCTLANNPGVTGLQNSLLQVSAAAGNRIYYSDGTSLRQIGRAGDAAINSDYDGYPLGLISYQGFAWIMNCAQQRRDDGTASYPWTVPAPAGAPVLTDLGTTAGLGVNGGNGAKLHLIEDNYRVTWVVPLLGETNPSPYALLTPAVDNSSTQIGRPASPPAGATGWNIYRQVPGYGGPSLDANTTPYLLNPAPIPIAQTTYVDTGNLIDSQDDTSLLLLGTIMEADHDPPPPARITANQTYNGRIVVANSAACPNRIWYTNPLQPAFFPGSADTYDGNWVDVGTDAGDEIRAITVRPGFLTIYRAKSIWIHLGDLGDPSAILQPGVPETGIVGPRAVASTSAADYFVSQDGLYSFNNDTAGKMTFKVDRIFRGLTTENFPVLGTAYIGTMAVGYRQGRLWVSYPSSAGAIGVVSLVLHVASGRWFAGSLGYAAFLDIGTGFLGANGGVFNLEASYASGTTALAFQSQYHDCGLPDRQKTWADLVLSHNTAGTTLSIICRLDKLGGTFGSSPPAATSFVLATFSSTTLTKQIFPLAYPATYTITALQGLPIKSFGLSIRITGAGAAGAPAIVESPILLHYYVEARMGQTFDSGITNHGLEGAGRIDQVEIDCDTSLGVASLTISSDIPGAVVAARSTTAIAQSTGREVLRVVLATPVAGRLFRHQMTTTTGFQIYGYKVRILPIGVYNDGSQGDFWYTLPLAPGQQGQQ